MSLTRQPVFFIEEKKERIMTSVVVEFMVVKVPSNYNIVLGRSTLCAIKVVVSQPHLYLNFPTTNGIGTIYGDQKMARECYYTELRAHEKGKMLAEQEEEEEEKKRPWQ